MSAENVSEVAGSAISSGSSLMSLLPMVAIFAIFYFLLIRPQTKRQKLVEKMISELKKGDKVIAAGGMYGVIHKIEDNVIYLEVADGVRIKALRSSVSEVLSKDAAVEVKAIEEVKVKTAANTDKPKPKTVKKKA